MWSWASSQAAGAAVASAARRVPCRRQHGTQQGRRTPEPCPVQGGGRFADTVQGRDGRPAQPAVGQRGEGRHRLVQRGRQRARGPLRHEAQAVGPVARCQVGHGHPGRCEHRDGVDPHAAALPDDLAADMRGPAPQGVGQRVQRPRRLRPVLG